MNDAPDDPSRNRRSTNDESTTVEDVTQDAEWEVVTQLPYDPSEPGGLTTTIVTAVAEAEGVSPSEIKEPPLYEVVDTTALEAALFGSNTGIRSSQCSTEFMYQGYRIAVQTDGWVLVQDQVEA